MTARALRHGRRLIARTLGRPIGHLADIQAIARLAPLSTSYTPWSPIAMRPSGVTAVLDDIVLRRRAAIVECGAGVTTIFVARLLRSRGRGHLWTIEHDVDWAALVENELGRDGLSEQVTMVVAPLEPGAPGDSNSRWYSQPILEQVLAGLRFDLLIVDGPPAWNHEIRMARYPAVPFFRARLAQDWTVVLDDVRRTGEEEIASRWERELGVPFSRRLIRGGVAVAYSQPGPHG